MRTSATLLLKCQEARSLLGSGAGSAGRLADGVVLFQPMAYCLGRHELTCPENPEPWREPATCLVCGKTLPRGAVLCWRHEGECARFAELDALIAAEEEAAAKVKARPVQEAFRGSSGAAYGPANR